MKSNHVFQSLLIIISIVTIPLGYVIYNTHILNCIKDDRNQQETWCPSFIQDFAKPTLLLTIAFIIIRQLFVWSSQPIGRYFVQKGESSEKVYSGKIIRFSHNFFKALYFLIVAGCAYSFLSEEPFFPAEFGGPGLMLSSTSSNLSVFKYSVAQSALITPVALPFIKYYFLVSAGFQLGNFYFLLVESQHSDLWETLAQVALALQLIFYGYTAKHLAVGSCLLLMHDVCDILTSACKALVHTTCKVSTFMGSMVLMVIWAYARLYCFGKLILIPMLREIEQQPPWKTSNIESSLFAILLLSLFFMNIYWFSLMVKSAMIFVDFGKVTDLHSPELTDCPTASSKKKLH